MQKFTLPQGTTNRHKWHKDAVKAISAVTRTFDMVRQRSGVIGVDEQDYIVSVISFGAKEHKNTAAVAVFQELGEKFDYELTRDNAADVAKAFRDALPKAQAGIPVEDTRRTPEQEAERIAESNRLAAEREAQQAEKASEADAIAEKLRSQYPWAVGSDTYKSGAARAAANLKKELASVFPGVRFSVTSDTFSMGNSVHVRYTDGPKHDEVDEIARKYQYGSFNGMIDLYEYDHSAYGDALDAVLGRSKYVSVNREISEPVKETATRLVCEYFGIGPNDRIECARDYHDAEPRNYARRFLSECAIYAQPDAFDGDGFTFPEKPEPVTAELSAAYEIQKHHHTKRGFDFWLVVLADRVERDQFNELRDSCKAAGGWYSRKWGSTPGGFAFREQSDAEAWAADTFGGDSPPPNGGKPSETRPTVSAKFREMAEKVRAEVEAKRAPHAENTPKRQREVMSRRIDADHLERTAEALTTLADLHDTGTVPALLAGFTSKKAIYEALRTRTDSQGYYHVADTGEHADTSPEASALWDLIGETKCPEQAKAEQLAAAVADVKSSKIPGYFRTPADLAAEMVDRLDIRHREPWTLLEPSAGDGALLDAVAELANEPAEVYCYEVAPKLREILSGKGYNAGGDFMDAHPERSLTPVDAVLMNPPFEKMADIEHVRHAFEFLKPGGRLVAIMSPGPFFRNDRKASDFRDWFDSLAGEVEDIDAGAFKESGTGVASRLVVIDKPNEIARNDFADSVLSEWLN